MKNIGIIGGGAAGLVSAWLLDAEYTINLFEKEDRLGGHARTIYVPTNQNIVPIETGFEFFNQELFPHFTHLLALLAIKTHSFPLTSTFYNLKNQTTLIFPPFRSQSIAWNMLLPKNLIVIAQLDYFLNQAKRSFPHISNTLRLQEFCDSLTFLTNSFKHSFLYPFLGSGWGASINDFKQFSAHDILKWFIHRPLRIKPIFWNEIVGGTSSYIQAIAQQLTTVNIKLSTAITTITFADSKYHISTANGTATSVDHLIIATDPQTACQLLQKIPQAQKAHSLLSQFDFFKTTIAVHGDTNLMPRKKEDWSVANIRYDGNQSYLTTYKPWKSSTDIFRSWISYDETLNSQSLPQPLYDLKNFHHQKVTPAFFIAQKGLKELQGTHNLWLAGHYMHDIDSHESAIVSAIKIAEKLAPFSKRLQSFK